MKKQYSGFNIDLKIEVENHFIYSNAKMNYLCNLPIMDELKFYIYKDFEVENIICDRAIRYEVGKEVVAWSPFVLESKLIKISFDEPILENESTNIEFIYNGHINIVTQFGINRLTNEWIELGLYTPWFPLSERLEPFLFNVKISLDEGYKVINSKEVDNYAIIKQCIPNVDCSIISSNCFKCTEGNSENINVNVYYTEEKYFKWAQQVSHYSTIILNKYKRFGKIDNQELSIVIAPREDGGGYCRPGLIVLTPKEDLTNEVDYFKFIAHELAHLWWCKSKNTDTWEDWLNESFAEFSALLAIREIFGEEEFNNRIRLYTEKTKGLPPIRNLNRNDDKAYQVLYMKGPVILNVLEQSIGRPKFEELLFEVCENNVDTTEKFMDKLCELTNRTVKENFNILLLK